MSIGAALMGWRGYAAAAIAGAAVAWTVQGWRYGAEIAELQRQRAEENDAQAQATVAAVEAARTEGMRRMAAVEKARDDAQTLAAAAAADAAGARGERDRMRARANALASAAAGRDPSLADGGSAGAVAVDLLAYMLGRAIDRAEALAGVADRARIAGLMCERTYDSLKSD